MERYSEFRPTAFDNAGLGCDNRQDWFVAPVSRDRDSNMRGVSNFETALEMMGGESSTVEVHRFGHWAHGWFEIILVKPDTREMEIAEEIEAALADYPVLDEEDMSRREYEEYLSSWDSFAAREFRSLLVEKFDLSEDYDAVLDNIDNEELLEFFESLIPSGEYWDWQGCSPRTYDAVQDCTRTQLREFLDRA